MKKSFIALAVLAASCGTAFAQSNIQLYGVLDGSVSVSKAKSGDAIVGFNSGFASGTRWGIKGVEDLGNGYSAGFVLEQGFKLDSGEAADKDRSFSRESQLFVTGNFGKLGFGRFGTLGSGTGSYSLLKGNVFGTTYGISDWNASGWNNGTVRANNSIAYVSPDMSGLTVSAMFSNGLVTDDKKFGDNDHYYGAGLAYKAGVVDASLILEDYDYADTKDLYVISLGGSVDLEGVTLYGAYQYLSQDDASKDHLFGLSADIPLAGGTAMIGAKYMFGKVKDQAMVDANGGEDKKSAWAIGAGYKYPLSKRTTVYSYAGYADGSNLYSGSTYYTGKRDTTGNLLDTATGVTINGWQAAVGMIHNF